MILILLFLVASVVLTLFGLVYIMPVAALMVALSILTSKIVFRFVGDPTKS